MNKAAQKLGKLAAGKPKHFSAAEIKRRKKRIAEARKKRWPKHRAKSESEKTRAEHKNPYAKTRQTYTKPPKSRGWMEGFKRP